MVMFFNVPEVKTFLLENGEVFTLRKMRKRVGNDIAVTGSYFKQIKLARINIELVGRIVDWSELIPYVEGSGLYTEKKIIPMTVIICPILDITEIYLLSRDDAKKLVSKRWLELAKKLSKTSDLYLYKVTVLDKRKVYKERC